MEKLSSLKKWLDAGGSRRKWIVGLFAASILITGIMFISGGSAPEYGALEPSPLYFMGIIVKLIAVLLLIIGGAIFLRRWQVKSGLGRFGGHLNVVETVRLSPKQAVHLVRVGKQHLLIGATDQAISMLATVDIPAVEAQPNPETNRAEGQPEKEQPQPSFMQLLQSLTANQPAPARVSDEIKETEQAVP
jgi:flagellar biosynthetic protein FliO